jgi:hypothetical protein
VDRTYDTFGPVDVDAWREEVTAKMAAKRSPRARPEAQGGLRGDA